MGNTPFENRLPEDARIIKEMGSWSFYASQADQKIYIKTDDYHPDPLKLSKEELLELIAIIDGSPISADMSGTAESVSPEEAATVVEQETKDC